MFTPLISRIYPNGGGGEGREIQNRHFSTKQTKSGLHDLKLHFLSICWVTLFQSTFPWISWLTESPSQVPSSAAFLFTTGSWLFTTATPWLTAASPWDPYSWSNYLGIPVLSCASHFSLLADSFKILKLIRKDKDEDLALSSKAN